MAVGCSLLGANAETGRLQLSEFIHSFVGGGRHSLPTLVVCVGLVWVGCMTTRVSPCPKTRPISLDCHALNL